MTHYIDGFLLPIATDKLAEYKSMATKAGAIWKEHGALDYWETQGDDLQTEGLISFATLAGCKENETAIFAWILFPSRAERDRINAAVMNDPRLKDMMNPELLTFDCKRIAYGGFKELVHL
jgi:uncharacterized protein YbaA (DUF1428 family)